MKKAILKISGLAAMTALMTYNVQLFDATDLGVSLAALGNVAVAQSEGDSTKRGDLLIINGERHPCGKQSTNYC